MASRPLANFDSPAGLLANPLLYILAAHALVGQLLLGLAMQRGSATAAVASMDAAAAIPAAFIGLFLLGDRITPGLEWLAAFGFVASAGLGDRPHPVRRAADPPERASSHASPSLAVGS